MITTEELDALEARIENINTALVDLLEQGRREQEIMGVGE